VAQFNKAIAVATHTGLPTNELADQRDALVMHLSKLTGATAMTRPDGSMDLFLGGSALVNGGASRQVAVSGATRLEDLAGSPVTLSWTDSGTAVGTESGQIASMLRTVNTTLAGYSNSLDDVAAAIAATVNGQHVAGYDLNGDAGTALFAGGPPVNARNIAVAITDPNLVAASTTTNGPGQGTLDGGNADAMANLALQMGSVDKAYRQLVVNLGVAAQAADRRATIQDSLTKDLDAARQAQTGVNLDEEMTNLMSFQRAYQAASRVITTIDESLDTLINHTGR
jgi:flagellar hook-associated protein 1 FlgK